MSYEQWLDEQAAGNERGLSLRQAFEGGQRDMLAKEQKTCEWKHTEGEFFDCWETECDNMFVINEGTPVDNKMNYCPYYGGLIKEASDENES